MTQEAKVQKRKKRAAKARGKGLEELFLRETQDAGWVARHEVRRSYGEQATDVLMDLPGTDIKMLLESKNRADWHISGEVRDKWLGQAEKDAGRFDEVRWPLLGHCNSPGKGVKREPLLVTRWAYFKEFMAAVAQLVAERDHFHQMAVASTDEGTHCYYKDLWESHQRERENMRRAVEDDAKTTQELRHGQSPKP